MLRVMVIKDSKIIKDRSFNELVEEDAVKKAFIECDRAVWSFEPGQAIGMFQNGKLLRTFVDESKGWIYTNNNGMYNYK